VADQQLMEVWRRAGARLDRARRSLADPGDDALGQFDEFRGHNELGLALDCLADVADSQRAPLVVWEQLQDAAAVMGLGEDDAAHGASVRLIREHLSRLGTWAELRRLLNGWDPIGVAEFAPEDEYDCLIPSLLSKLSAGAGREQISQFLWHELEDHFSLDPTGCDTDGIAGRVVTWWTQSASAMP
jgi:hypothetical protein